MSLGGGACVCICVCVRLLESLEPIEILVGTGSDQAVDVPTTLTCDWSPIAETVTTWLATIPVQRGRSVTLLSMTVAVPF